MFSVFNKKKQKVYTIKNCILNKYYIAQYDFENVLIIVCFIEWQKYALKKFGLMT